MNESERVERNKKAPKKQTASRRPARVASYWRRDESGKGPWHCMVRSSRGGVRYASMCSKIAADRIGSTACLRPDIAERCSPCDTAEMKAMGWSEPGPKSPPAALARDPVSGQYAFDGDFDRMCVCGHRLGDHIAGGFDCNVPLDHGLKRAEPCDCERFRPSRAKTPYCAPVVPIDAPRT